MDPASIIGIVQASGSIVSSIGGTIKNLNDIRRKFGNADLTIRLLISELSTIKNALNQIHDWAEYNLTDSQARRLGEDLDTTLDGCKLAMDVLAEDVAGLVGIDSQQLTVGPVRLGFRDKATLIWNETTVREHQDRLGRQTSALQLLLVAIQCHSISEQTNLLRAPENERKIQKIVDDTSTLRATRSQMGSMGAPSIFSHDESEISAKAFAWDDEIVNAEAYRKVLHHHKSKSDSKPRVTLVDPPLPPPDEGYETMSKGTAESTASDGNLSPVVPHYVGSKRVRPYETVRSPASEGDNISRSQSLSLRVPAVPFASEPKPVRYPSDSSRASLLGRRKSFWSNVSIRRKNNSVDASAPKPSPIKSPTVGYRPGKRGFENNVHTSINFASAHGMNCPQIVRAAQARSIVEIESLLDDGADIEECHQATGRNAMAVAAHCGNEEVVQLLLRYGAEISKRDASSSTPLHLAASRGHVGVMNLLLAEQANIEEPGPESKTPLRLSCDNGHREAAELLLMHRARVNARDMKNLTPLHAAAKAGDAAIADVLIRHGAHVEAKDGQIMAALHYASEGGHAEVIELLLDRKADIELAGQHGKTPLISAAAAGFAHAVDLLLRRKASLKARSAGEMTALHWAAFNGHAEVVDLLLQKKALVNTVNIERRSALHLAVMAEHFSVAEILLWKGAAIEAQCRSNLRPLHYACDYENVDVVRLLLSSGADIEAESGIGQRPLHRAVMKGSLPTITLLLEHGAHIDTRDAAGNRPLLLAILHGHTEVVRTLLDCGALLRSKFTAGPSLEDSPLCLAAKTGHSDIASLLIARGASVREKDEIGWQPLQYAAHYGHPEVVKQLLTCGASISGNQIWGLDLSANQITFANDVFIPDDRKRLIFNLLRDAEEREERNGLQRRRTVQQARTTSITVPTTAQAPTVDKSNILQTPQQDPFTPDFTTHIADPPGQEAEQPRVDRSLPWLPPSQTSSRPENGLVVPIPQPPRLPFTNSVASRPHSESPPPPPQRSDARSLTYLKSKVDRPRQENSQTSLPTLNPAQKPSKVDSMIKGLRQRAHDRTDRGRPLGEHSNDSQSSTTTARDAAMPALTIANGMAVDQFAGSPGVVFELPGTEVFELPAEKEEDVHPQQWSSRLIDELFNTDAPGIAL